MGTALLAKWNEFVPPSESHVSVQTVDGKQCEELMALLHALHKQQVARFLEAVQLVTLSGRTARLSSGGQQAVPTVDAMGHVSETFVEFGTSLDTLPTLLADSRIHLEVGVSVTSLDPAAGIAGPAGLANLERWYKEVSSRPSAKA